MNPYTFHINLYDLLFLGTVFIGLTFAMLLWVMQKNNRPANRLLALALFVTSLWIARILAIDIGLEIYLPNWGRLPMRFTLALGPLLFFYVLKLIHPERKFRFKDLLHFLPLLIELSAQLLETRESLGTGQATYRTHSFQQWNPLLQILAFTSVIIYLYASFRVIENFYQQQKFNGGDRYRNQLRWLSRLLKGFSFLWLLWIPFTAMDYFYFHYQLSIHAYYLLYILSAATFIRIAIVVHLRPATEGSGEAPKLPMSIVPVEIKQKGRWLKQVVKAELYYQDPELSLNSLAEKLGLGTHELSRIINKALKKNFTDFINEYRVAEVVSKMQDPASEHLTLLGIAFDAGFNSKTSFHRIFKQMTGKNPSEFKSALKKESPPYNMEPRFRVAPLHSYQQPAATNWVAKLSNRNFMFRNYLKTTWRHFASHKIYTTINVMGLALGICGCLVIYLVTSFEFSFDNFHPDKDRIYCIDVSMTDNPDPDHAHWNSVPAPMPAAMRNEMSGLETVAAFHHYNPKVKIKQGEKIVKAFDWTQAIIAEPGYFDIMSYTWLSGNAKISLLKPRSVVLTQSRAKTYFGDLPPAEMIGKTITYDDSLTVTVTGIVKDWNKNSDFSFSEFISFSTIDNSFLKDQIQPDNWYMLNHGSQELVKLPPGVNPSQIDAQFPAFIKRHIDPAPDTKLQARLQPFTSIHFHREYGGEGNKADGRVLFILSAVALFILFIAVFNFINLSTAQSIQRTKEIGIRKVLGSGKRAILLQFLFETLILTLIAIVIAVTALRPVLNLLSAYIPEGVKFDLTEYSNFIFLGILALFTTLLAGFYPAKLLAKFRPVSSLKGELNERSNTKGYLRKSLIIFQFTISLIFITATIVINKQIRYMQTQELGFKTSNIITLRSLWNDHTGKMKVLAEKLRQLPGVEQVIPEAFPPMGFAHMGNSINLQGSNKDFIQASIHSGNEDFVPFYKMKIIAGRNLLHSDSVGEYLINETAARALGFNDPGKAVGMPLLFGGQTKAYPIAGVLADFYENSFHQQIMPVVIANDPKVQNSLALKLMAAERQKGDIPLLVNRIAGEWKKVYPEEPFDYSFLGDYITRLYEMEQRMQWLMKIATIITIFISCMGLFGLAMFNTERRTKEISIRKVLGASVINILTMLNKEVIGLITISLVISAPVAWFFMHKWLQNFAYATRLSGWVFIVAGAGALLIALATVSFQTVRSAMANPVKGLRNE